MGPLLLAASALDWHRHPLVTVSVGFLLSGVLLSGLTRRLQRRSAAADTRRELIAEITGAVHRMLQAVQAAEVTGGPLATLNEAWARWKVEAAVIESKLRLYCRDPEIPVAWTALVERIDECYAMQEIRDPQARDQRVRSALRSPLEEATPGHERSRWGELRTEIISDMAALETRLLSTQLKS